jgi:hypothetical protein
VVGSRSRSAASATPTFTLAVTVADAPSIETRSVVAALVGEMRR